MSPMRNSCRNGIALAFNFSNLWGPWLSPLPSKTPTTAELFRRCGVLGLAPCHAKEMLVDPFDAAASFCHHAVGTSVL